MDPIAGKDAYLKPNNINTKSVIMGRDASSLGMNDFFNLLVAQMTNQDMMNPQSDTEFVAQMAQFTALQGIQTIQEYQLSSYATSYVGKHVSIAYANENQNGSLTKTEGIVEKVSFYDGEPKVTVNGFAYPLYSVMEVKTPEAAAKDKEANDDDTKTDTDNKTGTGDKDGDDKDKTT